MSNCPSLRQLECLLEEQVEEPELSVICAHVEQCPACQKVLGDLSSSSAGPGHANLILAFSVPPPAESSSFFSKLARHPNHELAAPPTVEGYQVLEEIGRGAAGVVYRALHLELGRLVALKMLLAGAHLSSESRGRLRREAQAIARLQHPNIIQIHGVGEAAGCPYLVLELVDGQSLSSWLKGIPRPDREAAQIVVTLARAVGYAHQNGVIHRDLKPANILIQADKSASASAAGSTSLDLRSLKISDFGLAKLLNVPEVAGETMTRTGAAIGTPAYAAPEQARGESAAAGPPADVYSLGVILYELITGRPPFQGPTPMDTMLQSAHEEPVPPIRLVNKVPPDLQTICLKCLEKTPARRYDTAAELADDLERFLQQSPIRARPVGRCEHAVRWVRRHQREALALAAAALLTVALVIGSLSAAAYFRKLEGEQHQLAQDNEKLAIEKDTERGKAVAAKSREASLRKTAQWQGESFRQNLYFAQMHLAARAASSPSGVERTLAMLTPWQQIGWTVDLHDLRQWEWYYMFGLCHADQRTLLGHTEDVLDVAYDTRGRWLASCGSDCTIRFWDTEQGQELKVLRGHRERVNALAWCPGIDRLASASSDGSVRVSTVNDSQELATGGAAGELLSVAWSCDAAYLAAGGRDGMVRVWKAEDLSLMTTFRAHDSAVTSLAWRPDGKTLATASSDFTIRLWDTDDWKQSQTLTGHANWVNKIAWSPDGLRLASVANDNLIKIWKPGDEQPPLTLQGHTEPLTSLAWSADGITLATGSLDRTARIWNTTTGAQQSIFRGHAGHVYAVAWNPKGNQIATGSADATIKFWSTTKGPEPRILHDSVARIDSLAWSRDGASLASAGEDGAVRLWNSIETGQSPATLSGHTGGVRCVTWDPSGRRLASASSDETIRIWNAAPGESLQTLRGHVGEVFSVSWRADGALLASGGADATVRIWNPETGAQVDCLRGHDQWVHGVAWSPDGSRLASASWDQSLIVWDPTGARPPLKFQGHQSQITSVAWSPDGERLASGSLDQTVRIWDAHRGQVLLTMRGHTSGVQSVDWSPDGKRLASASSDHTVKLWDTAGGDEALSISDYERDVNSVAWRPDGLTLASAGSDFQILLHDASDGHRAARSPQALPLLARAIAEQPEKPDLWIERAQANLLQGNFDAAAADAGEYLKATPYPPWVIAGQWVAGPFSNDPTTFRPRDRTASPLATPAASRPFEPQAANWQLVARTAEGFCDFGRIYGRGENTCAYALLYVYSPKPQRLAILIGSDDQALLSLNGQKLYQSLEPRPAAPETDAVAADLSAGWNRLVARVSNVAGDHALYLKLSNRSEDIARAAKANRRSTD